MLSKKYQRRLRIRRGIRKKVAGTSERPRLSIFRSNKAIYAQLINDAEGHTLASASSRELKSKKFDLDVSKEVGKNLAAKAKADGVETVIFDRAGYLYHGKVKALADGAREGGLKF